MPVLTLSSPRLLCHPSTVMYHTERDAFRSRPNSVRPRAVSVSSTGERTPLLIEDNINEFTPWHGGSARMNHHGGGQPIRPQIMEAPSAQRMFEERSMRRDESMARVEKAEKSEKLEMQRSRPRARDTMATPLNDQAFVSNSLVREQFTFPEACSLPPHEEQHGRLQSRGVMTTPMHDHAFANASPGWHEFNGRSISPPPPPRREDKRQMKASRLEQRTFEGRGRSLGRNDFTTHLEAGEKRRGRPRANEVIASPSREHLKSTIKAKPENRSKSRAPTVRRSLYPFPDRIVPPTPQPSAVKVSNVNHRDRLTARSCSRGRSTINAVSSPRVYMPGIEAGPLPFPHEGPLRVIYDRGDTTSTVGVVTAICITISVLAISFICWYFTLNFNDIRKSFVMWLKKEQQPKGFFASFWGE